MSTLSLHTELPRGLLLLGPTGSGKTPLGQLLEAEGLKDRPCHHFDFGEQLRRTDEIAAFPLLSDQDRKIIGTVLKKGALLEDDQFDIAGKILLSFLRERNIGPQDFIVMNGLPRHLGQAERVDRLVVISLVVLLECPTEIVHRRIRTNTGGDRQGRPDDSPAEIENKLRLYRERTRPLVDFYKRKAVPVIEVSIGAGSTPAEIRQILISRL